MAKYHIYGKQVTSYRATIEANSIEQANKILESDNSDYLEWKEVGELEWKNLYDETKRESYEETI